MMREKNTKTASEIFAGVDPHLKVINRRRISKKLSRKNWEDCGGAVCPRCKQEAVRFRPQDGVCWQCAGKLNEKESKEEAKQAAWLRHVKAHNARITNRKAR